MIRDHPPTKTMWRVVQTRLLGLAVAAVVIGVVGVAALWPRTHSLPYGKRLDDVCIAGAGLAIVGFLAARRRWYWTTCACGVVAACYAVAKSVAFAVIWRDASSSDTRQYGAAAATVLVAGLAAWTARRGLVIQRMERELYLAQLGAQGLSLSTDYEALEDPPADDVVDAGGGPTPKKTATTKSSGGLSFSSLLGMLKPYFWPRSRTGRVAVFSTIFSVTLSKVSTIVAPLLLSTAANAVSSRQVRVRRAVAYALGYAAVTFASKVFKECQSLAYLRVQKYAFVDLATDAFAHVHSLSLQWSLSKKMGEVVRVADRGIAGCDNLMRYGVLYVLPSCAECIAVCVIFATHFELWTLSALVFGSVVLYATLTVKLTLWRKRFRTTMNASDNKWHDHLTESLVNFEAVKHATAEAYELARFRGAIASYQSSSVRVQASLSLLNIAQQVILCGCLGGSLALMAAAVRDGKASVGAFVSVNVYIVNLFTPLNFLGSVYNTLIMAVVDLKNLSQLLAEPPLVTDAPDAIAHPNLRHGSAEGLRVTFRDVRFAYPVDAPRASAAAPPSVTKAPSPTTLNVRTPGLEGVSFDLDAGHSLGIVGPTGAGKSTIGRLLFRFYDVDAGSVLVGGVDVRKVTQSSLRRLLGVVPQDTVLFNESIAYNILYADPDKRGLGVDDPAARDVVERAAKRAELWDFVSSLEQGFETIVGERGLKLSGGEKQRVAIARLFVKNPPVVLLDEATSALDSRTERAIQRALKELAAARTSIAIAHRLSTIVDADAILVLRDGRVAEYGTHHDLLARPDGEYAAMWHAQLSQATTTTMASPAASQGDLQQACLDEDSKEDAAASRRSGGTSS